jgi:hypothetical protein
MSEEIKWDYTCTNLYSLWASDCLNYRIVVRHHRDDIAILEDHSIENEPVSCTASCKNLKEAKKLANLWKKGVFLL